MKFEVSSTLTYHATSPSTLILGNQALRTRSQTVLEESLRVDPPMKTDEIVSLSGDSRFVRIATTAEVDLKIEYRAVVETSCEIISGKKLDSVAVVQLEHSTLNYLFPSRYCQSDKLARLAWREFGHIQGTFEKVCAVRDWISANVDYERGSTDSQTSAFDTVTERAGVCRDFAHLGVALCRALNIPARYFSGYAYQLEPADLHACFEVFIGGRWIVFDATNLAPLNGLVRIGTGRDAADTSVASLFGNIRSTAMEVSCKCLSPEFKPLRANDLKGKGVCLEA
jgi:transglutaminase-like putative cysteine protease